MKNPEQGGSGFLSTSLRLGSLTARWDIGGWATALVSSMPNGRALSGAGCRTATLTTKR